jgi:hypothetical protein
MLTHFTANFASALAIELRRGDEDDSRDYLRFRFKNGTADAQFRTLRAFGHSGDIPLAEFIYRTQPYQIANKQQWNAVCSAGSFAPASRSSSSLRSSSSPTSARQRTAASASLRSSRARSRNASEQVSVFLHCSRYESRLCTHSYT